MCVCVCFVFQCIISSSFPQPRVLHFTTVLPFFFFIHKNFHREVFQVYPKKLPFQHSLTLGLLLCCLSLYFAINIVGLLAPIASGIQLVFSPPFQADTQSGKNSRPKSTSFSFFKVLTIVFLIFCSNSYGEELFKMVTTIGLPKKANSKARTTCCCLSGFINLKIGLLEDVCVCVLEMCGLS